MKLSHIFALTFTKLGLLKMSRKNVTKAIRAFEELYEDLTDGRGDVDPKDHAILSEIETNLMELDHCESLTFH